MIDWRSLTKRISISPHKFNICKSLLKYMIFFAAFNNAQLSASVVDKVMVDYNLLLQLMLLLPS
jgi:hypothetical protein